MRYFRLLLLLALGFTACAQAKPAGLKQTPPDTRTVQQQIDDETPEEAFHNIMAETFHAMEDGDFHPIKTRSREFAQKAKAWADDEMVKGRVTEENKSLFSTLVDDSNALEQMIGRSEPDSAIDRELTSLHDLMHEIMEKLRN